jgi:2-phospho-L-lactate guanylyltransferase
VSGGCHAFVPLKRLDAAKSRLSELLTPAERTDLTQAMLADVLVALGATAAVTATTLVSSEASAADLAREHGIGWWDDRGLEWNDALEAAMHELAGSELALLLSADIPLVTTAELETFLAAAPARGIAIARATDGGTNAVVLRPPAVVETCFGLPGSARVHAEAAQRLGLEAVIVDEPGLALDLDRPEDVARFLERQVETRAGTILRRTRQATLVRAR